MKKIAVFLLVIIIQSIYSQTEENNKTENYLSEISLKFVFPELYKPEPTIFVNFGSGLYYKIIPKIFMPGIFIDVGIGYDLMRILTEDDSDYKKIKNEEFEQFGLSSGLRLYNLIEIGSININTFSGYTFILGQLDKRASPIIHNPIVGASISIDFIGVEYAYYFPMEYSTNTTFHHISIFLHSKSNN